MAISLGMQGIVLLTLLILTITAFAATCMWDRCRSGRQTKPATRRRHHAMDDPDLEAGIRLETMAALRLASSCSRPEPISWPVGRPQGPLSLMSKEAACYSACSLLEHPALPSTKPSRLSTISKCLDKAALRLSLRIDPDSTSRWASDTTRSILSRRGSWPLQSSITYTRVPNGLEPAPKATLELVRWPFLGCVEGSYWDASSRREPEHAKQVYEDDRKGHRRSKTVSEADQKACSTRRYFAHPGPKLPLPSNAHDSSEYQASSVESTAQLTRLGAVQSSKPTIIQGGKHTSMQAEIRHVDDEEPEAHRHVLER